MNDRESALLCVISNVDLGLSLTDGGAYLVVSVPRLTLLHLLSSGFDLGECVCERESDKHPCD